MENKKFPSIIFIIIAVILGVALYKQFDRETLKFKNTYLAILYFGTFISSIFILIKDYANKPKK